jgi:hypothetical protein
MLLNDFLTAYTSAAKGSAERNSVAEDIWYDWFCNSSSLPRRTKKFIRPLKELVKAVLEAGLLTHPSGKNNCPVIGPTYDVLRLFDNDEEFIVWICFDDVREDHRFVVEDKEADVHFETDDRDEAIAKFIEVTRDYLTAKGLIKAKEIA